jgi:trehalose 6-phosphate phosphatase
VKDILSPRQRPVLERLARSRALLAFDYDGVLAPLVRDPMGVPLPPSTRWRLLRLARAWPCAVVSGRSFERTRLLTGGVLPVVVGNHGYELGRARPVPRAVLARVRGWREDMERELAGVAGAFFEDKRSTLAVHYGLGGQQRADERAVHRAAARLEGARLVRGKNVLNVIPASFPNKGDALRALLRRLGLETALYIGDDVTDEDAFAVGPPLVLGVRVGRGRSLAPYSLGRQDLVDELLDVLLELRSAPAARGSRAASGRSR